MAAGLRTAVAETGLLDPPGPVVLCCSAGRDSMALLDAALALRGPDGLHVLHVDHGLRDGAEADARHVRAAAAAAGVAVTVAHAGPAPGPGQGNLHAWARGRRAALADELSGRVAREAGPGVPAVRIATAHTRTDLAETAVGRLATQPGRRALLAMRQEETTAAGHRLVRPLLGITREETMRHCAAHAIGWREDPSNADRRYARARLRHEVLPVLRALNPQAEAAIARTLAELREESEVLDALVETLLPPGTDAIPLEQLAAQPPAIGRLLLRTLCERSAARPCPQVAARLPEVLALGGNRARIGRASLDVGGGVRIELRRGRLSAGASEGPAAPRG